MLTRLDRELRTRGEDLAGDQGLDLMHALTRVARGYLSQIARDCTIRDNKRNCGVRRASLRF